MDNATKEEMFGLWKDEKLATDAKDKLSTLSKVDHGMTVIAAQVDEQISIRLKMDKSDVGCNNIGTQTAPIFAVVFFKTPADTAFARITAENVLEDVRKAGLFQLEYTIELPH